MPSQQVDLGFIPQGFEKGIVDEERQQIALEQKSYPERYGLLESALSEAVERDVISPLPTKQPESRNEYAVSRLKTIRKRLFMLGYLDKDSGKANLGPILKAGILQFQKEASLAVTAFAVDGWVGEETWTALQELVSFEEPSNLERWFADGIRCKALKRAVHLRLYAFGFCLSKPKEEPDDKEINQGLKIFASVSNDLFHLSEGTVPGKWCFETASMLMDQDELVRCLAQAQPLSREVREKLERETPALLDNACQFVINVSKAELWMLGFDKVAPSGYRATDTRKAIDRRFELKGVLFNALKQFWKDRGDKGSLTKAHNHIIEYFPMFFQVIHSEISQETSDSPMDSQEIYLKLEEGIHEEQDKNLIDQVWHQICSIGSRIWDGIKRAWRWFKSTVKAGITYLKNLSRLAYNFILKSFEAVRAVVSGVVGSLSFFGELDVSFPLQGLGIDLSQPVLRMRRDGDFDFTTVVDDASNPESVSKVATYLENKSSMFAVSCKFLASLLDMVIDLIKRSVFSGWAVLLMALLRLYKIIRHWAPVIIAFERQERRMLVNEAGAVDVA